MAKNFAPGVGIEPTTNRLTGDRSTAELPRNFVFGIAQRNRWSQVFFC